MKYMQKGFILLVLSIALVLSVSSVFASEGTTRLETSTSVAINSEVVVNNLNDIKAEVNKSMNRFDATLVIKYEGDFNLIVEDLKNSLNIIGKGTYLEGVITKYNWSTKYTKQEAMITFDFEYNHTKEQERELNLAVDTIISQIIKPNMTDLEKIKAVNDYIVLQTEYSFTNDLGINVHSPYAIIKGNKAVCQGYALFAYKMLDSLGFEVQYVIGYTGEDHAWNLVKLASNWYHLDTTWNDPVPNREGFSNYSYFLMNDNEISKNHSWEVSNYPLSTDNSYDYFSDIAMAKTVDDTIYYLSKTHDNHLYKINIDGTGKKQLVDSRVQDFVINTNNIYYNNYSQGGYLYSINSDGSNNVRLNTDHSVDLNIKEGVLSYKLGASNIIKTVLLEANEDNTIDQPSSWAVNGVNKAKEFGLISSNLLSNYQSDLTREEFCEIIIKVYESLSSKTAELPSTNKFKDTTNDSVLKANVLGIVNGVSEDLFNPKESITREQIAIMLVKLLGALDINPILTAQYVYFADEAQIHDWAKSSVQTVYKLGIVSGIGEQKINPLGNTTREQAMLLAVNFFEIASK